MTLTIDAGYVWKCPDIFRIVAPVVDQVQEFENIKTVLIRVLSQFPIAWKAVIDALEELTGQPWAPLTELRL
jgi:hypothetical protein